MSEGVSVLREVALRIVLRYLSRSGASDVAGSPSSSLAAARGVDLHYSKLGRVHAVKLKPDPYFGTDPTKIADRGLPFYRATSDEYAVQTVADASTRRPGWGAASEADQLFYYFLAIDQTEDEIRAALEEPDESFFGTIAVVRDDLRIIPMDGLAAWFQANQGDFPTRPVQTDVGSAWYRLVPCAELEKALPGLVHVGPILAV